MLKYNFTPNSADQEDVNFLKQEYEKKKKITNLREIILRKRDNN